MEFASIDKRIDLFVKKNPGKTAIEYGEKKITYEQLYNTSSKIANFLIDNNTRFKNIFVLMDKNIELVETVLGIIKSGNVFVPMESTIPDHRMSNLMKKVKTEWIICTYDLLEKVSDVLKCVDFKVKILLIGSDNFNKMERCDNIEVFQLKNYDEKKDKVYEYCTNKQCYIYTTSGSTGKPKCILGRQDSLLHFIDWEIEEMKITEEDKVSQLTPISFDPFLRDVFVPLCAGATLCIPNSRDMVLNPKTLKIWIEKSQITLIHIIPSLFKILSNEIREKTDLPSVKYILLAGELLRGKDIKSFIQKVGNRIQLVNLYGPTETTLAKMFYRIKEEDAERLVIPVGKPINSTQVYILNDELNKCGKEIVGNIYIRTPFISSGYYDDKELTRKVFIRNPFTDNPNDIIYNTGDLGKKLTDGNVIIVGRKDNQVKIRGNRIELGEIENAILQYESIKEAIVIVKEEENNKFLCAYLVSGNEVNITQLRTHLLKYLTEAMIPEHFFQLGEMPLNKNGKVDRKKLAELENRIVSEYVEPRNELEKVLIQIWKDTLKIERIGIDNDFFELGGHSLKAVKLISQIYKKCNVEILPRVIFENSTIRKLADYISKHKESKYIVIPRLDKKEYYEASAAEKRFYMQQKLDENDITYNIPKIAVLEGKIDIVKMEETFNKLIQRHETLRTYFKVINGQVVQCIEEKVNFKVDYFESENINIETTVNNFIKPFNLNQAPLLRVSLIRINETKHIFMIDMHHIIFDAESIAILSNEFMGLYVGNKLEKINLQYKDYAEWHNKQLKSEKLKKMEEYWMNKFSGNIPVLDMATDYTRTSIRSLEGDRMFFKLDNDDFIKVKKLQKKFEITTYMFLLSVVNILLAKYSGQEDIVVGTPIAGRVHPDLYNTIGVFINMLPMRNFPNGNKTYEEFLKEVKEQSLEAYENQEYPFEELLDKLKTPTNLSRSPLFDVMFSVQNTDPLSMKFEGLKIKGYGYVNKTSKFDLSITAFEMNNELSFEFEFCTKLFKRETIERMTLHFKKLIKSIIEDDTAKIKDMDILTSDEYNLMKKFNDNSVSFNKDMHLHEWLESWAEKTPDNIAVQHDSEQITYNELNCKSNQIARYLKKKQIKEHENVVILLERSICMVESILGIWKAGHAYIPIDVKYPVERILEILNSSKVNIIITKSKHVDESLKRLFKGTIINLDLVEEEIKKEGNSNLNLKADTSNLAYIIYTSGSTGKPKGAMVEHIGMMNHMFAKINELNISEKSIIMQNASQCFDISVWQFFTSIISGGKTSIYSNDIILKPEKIVAKIIDDKITILELVPSFFNVLLEYLEKNRIVLDVLEYVVVTGEVLKASLVNRWFDLYSNIKMVNAYGPTEASDDITHFIIDKHQTMERIPIGYPLQNFNIYIADKYMRLCPVGVKGEICVSGIGVGRGYINDIERTNEVFMDNPFTEEKKIRLYKTGDLGRWLPDGNIDFFGRKDHQVKIRGFRIEIGEIEIKLLSLEGIKDAAVIDKEDTNGNNQLYAYFTSDRNMEVSDIRKNLLKILPQYMIPSHIIPIDQLPVLSNGKIDRKRLVVECNNIRTTDNYQAPINEVEQKISDIWEQILGVENVSTDSNFFELGGNSIKIIYMMMKVKEILNVDLSLEEFIINPTIKYLGNYINSNTEYNLTISDKVLLIKKTEHSDRNLFLIHDGFGGIEGYTEFCLNSKSDFNCWAINYENHMNSYPSDITIEELAKKYIDIIKSIQDHGSYYIGGWSIGGVIAYEIVKQMKLAKDEVSILIQFDSKAPVNNTEEERGEYTLNLESERKFINNIIQDEVLKEKIETIKSLEELWGFITVFLENNPMKFEEVRSMIPENFARGIDEDESKEVKNFIRYVNRVRTLEMAYLKYSPDTKINTNLLFFKSEKSIENKQVEWKSFINNEINCIEIAGDHYTMMQSPNVLKSVDEFDKIFR